MADPETAMEEGAGLPATSAAQYRQQDLYWKQLVELKALSAFIRRYRDQQASQVRWIGIVKGIAASSTIPGWVFFPRYDYLWGVITGASQLADAVKDAIPYAKRHKAAAELAIALERLFIDAQFEWESIYARQLSDTEITTRRQKLAQRQLDAERAHFPDGIAQDARLDRLAKREASDYMMYVYGERAGND